MNCVKTSSISIMGNRDTSPRFHPSRGLHQGDLLSPLLFIICMVGFSDLINYFKQRGLWKGIQVHQLSLEITHMLFMDDKIVFAESSGINI